MPSKQVAARLRVPVYRWRKPEWNRYWHTRAAYQYIFQFSTHRIDEVTPDKLIKYCGFMVVPGRLATVTSRTRVLIPPEVFQWLLGRDGWQCRAMAAGMNHGRASVQYAHERIVEFGLFRTDTSGGWKLAQPELVAAFNDWIVEMIESGVDDLTPWMNPD